MNDSSMPTDSLPPEPPVSSVVARRIGHSARGALGSADRRRRTDSALAALESLREMTGPGHLATYAAAGDELDPSAVVALWRRRGWELHLPRIGADGNGEPTMDFVAWSPTSPLLVNRFGIDEPSGPTTAVTELDVVILPAVAVDSTGTRVGFGAGYYDRALGATRRDRTDAKAIGPADPSGPLLIGIAFEVQCVEAIERREWDVPLDVLVTDAGVRRFDSPGRHAPEPVPDAGGGAPAR